MPRSTPKAKKTNRRERRLAATAHTRPHRSSTLRPATKSASSAGRKRAGRGRVESFTAAEVAKALLAAHGFLSDAARALGCHRDTIAAYVERHPQVAAARRTARESFKDLAEGQLVKAIRKSRPWAICFFLKTQAKDRGYTERTEIAPESVDQMARKVVEAARELRGTVGLVPPPPAEAAA